MTPCKPRLLQDSYQEHDSSVDDGLEQNRLDERCRVKAAEEWQQIRPCGRI